MHRPTNRSKPKAAEFRENGHNAMTTPEFPGAFGAGARHSVAAIELPRIFGRESELPGCDCSGFWKQFCALAQELVRGEASKKTHAGKWSMMGSRHPPENTSGRNRYLDRKKYRMMAQKLAPSPREYLRKESLSGQEKVSNDGAKKRQGRS
jgi:hypothetical protein